MRTPENWPILEIGRPELREQASPVSEHAVPSDTLDETIDDLMHTCAERDGMGIAGPQVGMMLRIIVVASKPNDRYPNAPTMEPLAMINPIIVGASTKIEEDWEGCLSVPGIRARVPRPHWVRVSFFDRNRGNRTEVYHGFVARIIQHEIDHLDGKLFIDRVPSTALVSENEYRRIRSLAKS